MITVNRDDYVIAKHRGKPTLFLVLDPKSMRSVIENTVHTDEPEHVTVEEEDILCNLGLKPHHGKLYGIDVQPYLRTIESTKFGPIHLFRDVPKKELKSLREVMNTVYNEYKAQASVAFLPLHQIRILPKRGKYAGMYKAKARGSEVFDSIDLFPETFADPIFNAYMMAHEFAHGLWYRCVDYPTRVKWMNLYQKRLKLSSVEEKHLQELCDDVMRYEGGIRDYMKEVADDTEKMVVKEVLGHFKRHHKMAPQDVDMMLSHDSSKLAEMWPTAAVLIEERPDVSTYSMTKVEEFFAEAVAFTIVGKTLPKDVKNGIDYTFKKCKRLIADD